MSAQNSTKSEDLLPNAIDKCFADGIIKTGSGLALGAALSLLVFKRRMWPVYIGLGSGLGMTLANCQNSLKQFGKADLPPK